MSQAEHSDDDLKRDPHLARLLAAGGSDDAPPPALDAAILAAARREVGARPQAVGGGAATVTAPRAKRNWYVPVSVAAVLVLSVSLVTLMKEERGDDLAQPPAPIQTAKPAPAAEGGVAEDRATLAAKPEAPAVSSEPLAREPRRVDVAKEDQAAPTVLSASPPKADVPVPPSAPAPMPTLPRQQTPAIQERAPATAAAGAAANSVQPPSGAIPGAAPAPAAPSVAATAPPPAAMRQDPFPAARERQVPASRDAPAPRPRVEAETAPVLADAVPPPVGAARPAAPPAVAARPAPAPMEVREPAATPDEARAAASRAPVVQGRMAAPGAAEKPSPKMLAKAEAQSSARPAWLAELDHQPPEKWLERLAEFKRDGRAADAEILMNEFRRRYPQHPASAR